MRGRCLVLGWGVVFGYQQGGFEDAGLDGLDFDGGGEVGGEVGVDFCEGGMEFAADGHPFCGFEVVVLEEEEEGGGEEEGGVLAVELRFAELGRLVGRWLGGGVAGDWWGGGG